MLGGYIVGHCLIKNVRMNMCQILNGYRGRAVCICKYQSIISGKKEREITYFLFYFNVNLTFK